MGVILEEFCAKVATVLTSFEAACAESGVSYSAVDAAPIFDLRQ